MLRIFKNFRKQEVVLALFSVVFVVAQVWLELKLPDYMREITSLITTQDSAMHDILIAGGKMLLCAFGSLLVTVLVAVCASRIASNFSAIVRGKLFDKVQSFSMEEIGRFLINAPVIAEDPGRLPRGKTDMVFQNVIFQLIYRIRRERRKYFRF